MIRKVKNPDEARQEIFRLCSAGEYSSGEVMERLSRRGVTGEAAYAIVRELIERKFVDDERFARAFVRERVAYARWGRLKIRHALLQKRIDSGIINMAMEDEIDDEQYCRNLASALESKARSMGRILSVAEKQRLIRFAAGRGYEPSLIMEMLPEEDYWRYGDAD